MIKGAYTLLITPFKKDLSLDEDGLRQLVQMQVDAGIHGIAPLGVTGENTMMTDAEIYRVVEIVVEVAKGKCKIVPDACSTSLWEAKERVSKFIEIGADYISVFTPYFVLPKQEGLIDFYEKLADFSSVPIVLHNAPERTGVDMAPETTAHLAKHPNIVGIKDGNKKLDHLAKILHLTKNEDFLLFTGKDTTAYPVITFGGSGTFTVAGNVLPGVMKNLTDYALAKDYKNAEKLHNEYYELFEAFRFESNPMAAKMALNLLGLPGGGHRSPLTSLSEGKTKILKSLLIEKGLLKV